jgi:hypothetical protein
MTGDRAVFKALDSLTTIAYMTSMPELAKVATKHSGIIRATLLRGTAINPGPLTDLDLLKVRDIIDRVRRGQKPLATPENAANPLETAFAELLRRRKAPQLDAQQAQTIIDWYHDFVKSEEGEEIGPEYQQLLETLYAIVRTDKVSNAA